MHNLANCFRQIWAKFGQIWRKLGQIWADLDKFGQIWVKFCMFVQKSKSCILKAITFDFLRLCRILSSIIYKRRFISLHYRRYISEFLW